MKLSRILVGIDKILYGFNNFIKDIRKLAVKFNQEICFNPRITFCKQIFFIFFI